MKPSSQPPGFATIVRDFFCDWLLNQQNVSPHTVASYRDTFRLLLRFMENKRQRPAAAVTLADLDAPAILAFLDDLESDRKNAVRTRNSRLAAIRAFARHAAARDPTALPSLQRVLAIPRKRFDRPLLGYLTRAEVEAVLNAPDPAAWSGRRDRAMFTLMYNTGAGIGGDRPVLRRRASGPDSVRPYPWERAQGAIGPVVESYRGRPQTVARGDQPPRHIAAVSKPARQPSHAIRR